jgi:hypothetical protein
MVVCVISGSLIPASIRVALMLSILSRKIIGVKVRRKCLFCLPWFCLIFLSLFAFLLRMANAHFYRFAVTVKWMHACEVPRIVPGS